MKEAILYRLVFYSAFLLLCAGILFLISLLNEAPFRSVNMRDSYYYGCGMGAKPLTEEKIKMCSDAADLYKITLDDLDIQMEKLGVYDN